MIDPKKKNDFFKFLAQGMTQVAAGKKAGISPASVQRMMKAHREELAREGERDETREKKLPAPIPFKELKPEAKRALEDFDYFQRRYFGFVGFPWQTEAAQNVLEYLNTSDIEYLVVNAPPGSGKSMVFTWLLPCWLTVRDRAITGIIMSATAGTANKYTGRILRTLEATRPMQADLKMARRGLAFDAEACLAEDFGRFRTNDLWRKEEFVVMQMGGYSITSKEPTWQSFGADSEYIGNRVDILLADDLVTPKNQRTIDSREKIENSWDSVAENRLDVGGLCVNQGQRIAPWDLYRYNLNKVVPDEEGNEVPKYHHIKYPLHDESRCVGEHGEDAEPYPKGCMLVPALRNWRFIREVSTMDNYRTIQQQEDANPDDVFVEKDWIDGGGNYPGCKDVERKYLEVPASKNRLLSVACIDPSPTNYWGCTWWLVDKDEERRYLMDVEKRKFDSNQVLDRDYATGAFTGMMEDWQSRSIRLGVPITHWIVEINAAQRFMYQYQHFQDWMRTRGVEVIRHSTGVNKSDPTYGIGTLPQHYKFGRIRLPYGDMEARRITNRLAEEVLHYPGWRTDDLVMSQWFLEWNLPQLSRPHAVDKRQWVPTWAQRTG